MSERQLSVNDISGLNKTTVWAVVNPTSKEEVRETIQRADGPISIGGGRFSMGGQIASTGSLHLDMRSMNRVLGFDPVAQTIRVESGVRWCDIQKFIDPHDLSVRIMQTYANFTVGGALSVNCHGRYLGQGPVVLSVLEIEVVLPNGESVVASPDSNRELFNAVIGGYGAVGVIVEATLQLTENCKVERVTRRLPVADYLSYFKSTIRPSETAVFHNADLYPPHYQKANSVTWHKTDKMVTQPKRLQACRKSYVFEVYFFWLISELPFGKWRREWIIDPLFYRKKVVHWRNYEAGYDVAELEPVSRKKNSYVLQEYFVPIDQIDNFIPRMAEIFQRHNVNVINVSLRHASADPGTNLAWARSETFALVIYYKQGTNKSACRQVAVWTREMISAVIDCDGSYYLPYQIHATKEQFHRAYPNAKNLFELKHKLDPNYRFQNSLWQAYYDSSEADETSPASDTGEFVGVYSSVYWADKFFHFLQTVFNLQPEDRMHSLIADLTEKFDKDELIYRALQDQLPTIKPALSDVRYSLPALFKQRRVMAEQTLQLLGDDTTIDGYMEIGSPARYLAGMRKHLDLKGPMYVVDEIEPGNSPVDIIERKKFGKVGRFFSLADYAPIANNELAAQSLDLITCYIGLHHIAPENLDPFVESIVRLLRPGGRFVLRDHDVQDEQMDRLVALVHSVFNAGTGVPWEENAKEPRYFNSLSHWIDVLKRHKLVEIGERLYQANDPSLNALMCFRKEGQP